MGRDALRGSASTSARAWSATIEAHKSRAVTSVMSGLVRHGRTVFNPTVVETGRSVAHKAKRRTRTIALFGGVALALAALSNRREEKVGGEPRWGPRSREVDGASAWNRLP